MMKLYFTLVILTILGATNAAVVRSNDVTDPDGDGSLSDQLAVVTKESLEELYKGVQGMKRNWETFIEAMCHKIVKEIGEYGEVFKLFIKAIPMKQKQELVIGILRAAHRQTKTTCGSVLTNFNPLNPKLASWEENQGRFTRDADDETELVTLTKLGGLVATFFSNFDQLVQSVISKELPFYCSFLEASILDEIQKMSDEEFFKNKLKYWN